MSDGVSGVASVENGYDCHSSCRARLILVGGMLLMRLDSAWNRLESCAVVKH